MASKTYTFNDFREDLSEFWKEHGREVLVGILTVAIVFGLIFGGMWLSPMGPVQMVVGFGMLVVGSAIAVCVPLLW